MGGQSKSPVASHVYSVACEAWCGFAQIWAFEAVLIVHDLWLVIRARREARGPGPGRAAAGPWRPRPQPQPPAFKRSPPLCFPDFSRSFKNTQRFPTRFWCQLHSPWWQLGAQNAFRADTFFRQSTRWQMLSIKRFNPIYIKVYGGGPLALLRVFTWNSSCVSPPISCDSAARCRDPRRATRESGRAILRSALPASRSAFFLQAKGSSWFSLLSSVQFSDFHEVVCFS